MFFCEICENLKNTYFQHHLRTTACNKFAFKDSFGKIILHACSYVWSILKDYVKNCGGVYVCWTCNWWKKMSKIQTNKGSILNINVLNVLLSIFDINECSKIRNTGNIGNDKTKNENKYRTKIKVKAPLVKEKEVCTNMTVAVTQSQIHIHWELQIEIEEGLEAMSF